MTEDEWDYIERMTEDEWDDIERWLTALPDLPVPWDAAKRLAAYAVQERGSGRCALCEHAKARFVLARWVEIGGCSALLFVGLCERCFCLPTALDRLERMLPTRRGVP